ncbi:MAG: nicotinate phosphoribosyltransferase [Janthinobacterium lividum]
MMLDDSIIAPLLTDAYKLGHGAMEPIGTELVYSNGTCRSAKRAKVLPDFDNKVVIANTQAMARYLLKDYWNKTFFHQKKDDVMDIYKTVVDSMMGNGRVNIDAMAQLHDLGYLPIHVKSLPDGSRVNIRVPFYTIANTHRDFAWVTNYLESQMSAETWKPIVNATVAREFNRSMIKYANETGVDLTFVDVQGHDFSMRGMSGVWDGIINAAAHLYSFKGTDTVGAIPFLMKYYPGDPNEIIGKSVIATEHSLSELARPENELFNLRRLIKEVHPNGILSYVADTWDYWRVIGEYFKILKPEIMERDGTLVARPDSGDPVLIMCGDESKPVGSLEYKGTAEVLYDNFPGPNTGKGFKQLDSHVGSIYGDSISLERHEAIASRLKAKGFANNVLVYGIGSYTYNYCTRDTFGMAIKATFGKISGEEFDLFKDPKTDDGVKKSAKGRVRVEFEDGDFKLYDQQTEEQEKRGLLKTLFLDGNVGETQSLKQVRERVIRGY